MKIRHLFAAGMAAALVAGAAFAENPVTTTIPKTGYLKDGQFDLLKVLPPAPVKGDARFEADRKIFRLTRRFVGQPRYEMATQDAKFDVRDLMEDYSCAVGVELTPENAPHVAQLVAKAGADTLNQSHAAKMHYKRLRPFFFDKGTTCQPKEEIGKSYDYPSGHTTWGWTWATVLSQLVPSRATEILARGRAYGESRIVCGVHNYSAVEGGRLSAASTMNVVETTADYQKDFAVAKQEIQALIHNPGSAKPKSCQAETDLVGLNIFALPKKK